MAGLLGVEESAFAEAYWAHRDAYDLGSSDLAYWSAVADALGVPLPPGAVDALVGAEVEIWTRLDDASRILVEDLRRRGTRLALLSNAPHALARTAERSDWAAHFDRLMFSADHGLAKPDPAVCQRMTALLGTRTAPSSSWTTWCPSDTAGWPCCSYRKSCPSLSTPVPPPW
ncbi:HAD family hydrolase [Streptomyces melanosporofaciens]